MSNEHEERAAVQKQRIAHIRWALQQYPGMRLDREYTADLLAYLDEASAELARLRAIVEAADALRDWVGALPVPDSSTHIDIVLRRKIVESLDAYDAARGKR